MKFYGVMKGRHPGVYQTWPECNAQVLGFSGAAFKSFPTEEDAQDYVSGGLTTQMAALCSLECNQCSVLREQLVTMEKEVEGLRCRLLAIKALTLQ